MCQRAAAFPTTTLWLRLPMGIGTRMSGSYGTCWVEVATTAAEWLLVPFCCDTGLLTLPVLPVVISPLVRGQAAIAANAEMMLLTMGILAAAAAPRLLVPPTVATSSARTSIVIVKIITTDAT